jgi:hypothetical protein
MRCQRCGQGVVLEVRLNSLSEVAYLCDECEALWLRREQIGPEGFVDFSTYMESHGRPGLWSEITVLKEVKDDPEPAHRNSDQDTQAGGV